jgi:hypothetical protein
MSQITKDPLGNDVELLNLTEWSDKNQKELNEDTLNQYAGYATGQFLRSGQKPEDFQDKLYSRLFQKGQQAGVFQPQDEAQTTQLFESFANKPLTDDAADLDLVSKSLLNTDPEQAARVADVYQRVKSGQPDPNLELDLEDVRKNIATPDRIQEARIGYAKERGLGFIDYPTSEPGKRDVWVNTQANPDRKAVYDTLDLAQGIVDPRSAALAEEWIKTDPGRKVNRAAQRKNAEAQNLIQNIIDTAGPDSAIRQGFETTGEYASEAANEFGARTADITGKAPTDKTTTRELVASAPASPVGPAQLPTGPVFTVKETRTPSMRVADAALRATYANLKRTEPNSPLVTDYTEDEFMNAGRDFVLQRINTPTNQDDPTKNFVTLTDGTRTPLASAALLPKEKFAQAMDTLGLDEKEKAAASSIRTGWISANLTPIRDALFDFEGDKFLEFTQKNVDKYSGTVELTEAYLDQMEPSARKTFGAKTQGVIRSIPNSLSAIAQAVGGGASIAINWEGGQKAFADWAEADAMQEQRRGTYVNLYGGELGLGYTIVSQAAPLLADIFISKGAATLAKGGVKVAASANTLARSAPVIGSTVRSAEGLMGQTAKTFIGNAIKPETKGFVSNYLKGFAVGGAEKSPAQILRAVRRDIEEKFVAGTARATQIGTGFARSAQGVYVNTSMGMRQETNPDGTPKYTEEQIKEAAITNALYSGVITALVEFGFGRVFGEGADVTAIGTANLRQIKSYSNRLTSALERGGFGGQELFDTVKQVSQEIVNKGWGDAIKQIPAEALEEFTDEFTQNVVQNLLSDEQINFKQAFTQGLQAAVVGGVYGGAFGTTNKIGLRQADIARDTFAGTAQSIERDLMDRTVAKLQESGGNPETIAALQDRMRVAQRRGQAISEIIPVRAAKREIIDRLDATSEEPFEISTAPAEPPATKAPASITRKAKKKAKELAVSEEELSSIQPSGTDKQGAPQITPNDVLAFVNRRTEQMGRDLNSFLPGPNITAPEGGFQLVGDEQADNPENRTFNDLSNRVVVIDGLRGRLRIEDEGVILDPEDGSTPFEITPNKDLPVKDFEGFNTLLQEGAVVSPRRQAREVSEVTDGGQIVYGDTTYDLPEQPLIANVKKDDTGAVESMHMRVFNSKGLATWVYVAGDNVPKVETAYRTRGPEAVTNLASAVESAGRENTRRNIAAQTAKTKQSKQRRKDKRAKNNAPLVTDRGQRAAESAPDYRVANINKPNAPQQLVDEIRAVALQLGIDPEVFTDDAELFAMVAPELAAGMDLETFTPQQKKQAIDNLRRNGNNPETLLEYLVSDELLPPVKRVERDSNLAALRARHSNQIRKHGIKPGADIKTVLESAARSATSKVHRQTAKELLMLGADSVPVSFSYLPNNLGMAGAYLPQSNAVVINLASDNGGGALDALLHELGHAVTDRVVTAPRNDFERQIRDRLMSLRAEYAERANAKYGNNMPPDLRYALEGRQRVSEPFSELEGARELVAHFYGSARFREQLVELSPKGERNFVQKFIDLIASLFSGQPVASKQYKELAELIADLSRANQTIGANPYGRTVAQVAASRAGVNHENRVGPLFGVPNPHSRDDLEWILHQVQTLRYSDLSNEEINDIILNQRFGMFTGENPNDTQFPEKENKEFNKKATQWLQDRGYQVIPIVGKYNRGENSFLVPGLTDQDAVDAANELVQDSVVTNTGMYFKGGMYHPRVGESINQPIGANDNFFSTLLDTNGNVTTIRVDYDFDTSLDSGIKYSKGDQQAAPVTKIARSLAAQGEFQVVEDREINKPMQFVDGRLAVNPALADARYEAYDAEDAGDLQELDTRLAVAIGLANESNGPDIQLSFEEVGLSPDSVLEQAAYNTLTNSDLQDLLKVKEQAKQFVASAYYHIALRNNGDNERLATAQNRVADLYRYLLRDGAGLPDAPEKFNALDISPVTMQLASRAASPAPIVRYSRAAVNIDPVQVRAQTKAGKAVGTRNPTSAKATEDGADPSNLVDLASLKRNTQAYRKNALLLLEYPIVAREFPKLAKEYAKIRGAVLKAQDKAKANGIKIKGAKDTAKKTFANYLGVPKNNVSGKMLEDAIENPESAFVTKEQPGTIAGNKEARARNKALAEFNKNLDQIKKYEAEGAVLGTDSSKALKTYTDTLDKIAKDPKHAIAKQADEIYDTLIEVTKSNLRMLMDVFPSDIRDIANLWYDGANIIAQQFAGDNYSLEQSAGVLAVFSPQKDWFMNVELAKRTMEIWTADQEYEWDDAMSARWLMRGGEPELKENKDGTVGYAKGIKPDLDENGEHRTDENGMLLFHGWGSEKVKAKRQQAFERLQSLKGKKLKDLSPEQQAWFVRMRAETKYATSFPIVSPDGRFGTPSSSTNNKGVTKEIKLAWGTYGSIGKAISILTAPSETQMKVISDELGDQHKVRSFYNNIVDPQNADGHVTMDTHAIAALFWQAFSGNSREVGQNFGTANTATDSLTGVGGLYPAFAEAYRAVAADYGMLPRQVQSITWEAVRMLFTARWKSKPENVNGVRAVWARYQNNEITLEQAQTAVFAMATNGKDLATAVANSNDEELGLGFPSYADITEGPAPAGVGIARSRAAQLDTDYLAAVNAGDVAAQQRLVDAAAKAAGGVEVYHGGDLEGSTIDFEKAKRGAVTARREGTFYGSTSKEVAQSYRGKTNRMFFFLQNPFEISTPENRPASWTGKTAEIRNGKRVERKTSLSIGEAIDRAKQNNRDGVVYSNIVDVGPAWDEGNPIGNTVVVFNSNQAKSADPIVRDDNGNVIPLSQRFDLTKQDIRYSRAAQLDADYLAAVEKGDTEAAQRMVDGAAKAAGYNRKGIRFGFYVDGVPLPPALSDSNFGSGYYVAEDAKMNLSSNSVSVSPTPNKKALEKLGLREDQVQFISGPVFVNAENPLPQNLTEAEKDFINASIAYESAVNEAYVEIAGTRPLPDMPKYLKVEDLVRLRGGDALAASIYGAEHTKYSNTISKLIRDKRLPYDSVRGIGGRTMSGDMSSELVVQSASQIKSADPVTYDDNGNVIPLSQRFDLTKQDIRYSKAGLNTAPKAFRGRMVQLTHWSKATELKETDPSEHGNGGAGKELERRREYGDIYMPRTYFGYGKYRRETQVGVNRYSMLVNGDTLYDLDRDPLDLYPGQDELQKAGYARFDNRAALTLLEKAVKDAGFKGYVSTSYQAGVLFNKQKVTKVKDGDTSLPLAAPASIAKSLANLTPVTPAEEKAAGKATARRNAPELAVAAVRMIEGKITVDEYADLVGFFDPWEVKGAADAPAIDKIKQYIDASKVDKVGVAVADRTVVEARIDIPTYNRSTAAGESVYAITLHQPAAETATRVAAPLSYTSVARITNPTMVVRAISGKGEARDIAAGTGKFPLATVKGNISTITEMPADINDPEVWTEVGFNPVRSSDFVDVRSKFAVVGGSEAIMVGPRVFVRNAEFAERASGYMTDKSPRYSRALYGIVSPDVESAYAVSLDDLYINKATGEWDAGGPITNLFRAAGDLDPRLFEAAKYQERGLRLVKGRLKDLMQGFKAALKAEPNADLDDVNVALGSTEPTVSAAQRDAAESARRARVDKANEQFDRDPANQAYAAAVQAARVAYATHRNKQKYTAEIQQARDARKNSPEMQQRDAAIAAADAQYNKDIQDARAKNLVPVRRAQQQAQLRLEANSPETAKVIADFRVAIDSLSAQLSAELGQANPLSAIVDQNLGVYLTRSYKIHQDEGYAQRVLEDSEFAHQREQARQFFEREWVATTYEKWRADVAYEPYSDAEVMSLVRAEATSKNVGTRDLYKFIDKHGSTPKTIGRTTSRTDLTRFMQKGEVPAELRPLLGEIQNPIENAMRTYANLAQFLGTQRLLSQYTQLGLDNGWLVPAADVDNDPVKYRGYAPLVNTTDTRGGEPLSEYYAEPDVVEAFQTMFNPAAEATRSSAKIVIDGLGMVSARAVGTSMGALTLGSAGFFMRNLTGILTFIGANGFVPTPSNIVTALKGLYQVYYTNMEGLGADLTMLGLTEDSLISTTMRDFMRNAIEDPETVTNQIESMLGELSTPGNWLAKSWKTAKVGVDALVKLNDQIDSFYKIAYWAHEIDVQTKANKHRATPLTPQQIKQEAARVVRLTTQGRERVVPIAKEFGRSGFGLLLNSFFRFTAEMYRLPLATTQLAMQEMKSGNPVLRNRGIRRLTGLGATLALTGHGAQALLKELLGFGDDEEEAIRKGQPIYNRDANLFFSHNPEEGTVSVFDITYVNGFSPVVDMFGRAIHHATNGRWEKVPGTILAGMAKNFVSPQIAVEALTQASSNKNDYGAALWLEDDSFTTKGGKFLKHVISNAYKLKTPTNFYKAFAAYANNGVYDKEAALELAGKLANEFKPLRVKTDPVEEHAARSFKVLKREMDAARKSLGDFNTFESLSQDGVDEIYDRYEDSSIAINERLNKFARGFQKLGLSYKQLQKIAYEEADISKNRFEQAVKFNRVERFVPSDDALEMYKKRGKENGPARVQYIKQAYKKRPRYTYLKKR